MVDEFTFRYDDVPFKNMSVPGVLERRVRALDDETFIHYGHEDYDVSFEELNAISNAVANALGARGVEPGQRVSVMFRDPLRTLFAMFGIQKAGAVFSPINFEYRGASLSYQINDTEPALLLIERQYVDRLNFVADELADGLSVVVYENDTGDGTDLSDGFDSEGSFADLLDSSTADPGVSVDWSDPASVIYTSGTTGKPKGAIITHRHLFLNTWHLTYVLLTPDDVTHLVLPMYHTAGLGTVLSSLAVGARVSLWDRFSSSQFWDRVDRYGATHTALFSVMQSWLLNQDAPESHNTLDKVGMQPLSDNWREITRQFGFDFVVVGFGQTESGNSTFGLIHAAQDEHATPERVRKGRSPAAIRDRAEDLGVPVVSDVPGDRWMGQPLSYLKDVAVVDDSDEPLPSGEVGEFVLRSKIPGTMLTRYLQKPEQTVEATRNLWFHTEDAVYRDEDGHYFFVDRMGDVIRRRGENISSIQIEDVAETHDAVGAAAAFPVPAEEGGEDEVALAVRVDEEGALTAATLTDFLRPRLPEFMIPKYVTVRESLPETNTGKIQKYKVQETLLERNGPDGQDRR